MSKKLFFTSDTHFYHGNIIKYCFRPFLGELDKRELAKIGAWHDGNWKGSNASRWRMSDEAIHLMNDTLINEINAVVGEDDVLWHLGDFGMAPKEESRLKRYYEGCRKCRDRIKCRNVNLIKGNHDDPIIYDLFNQVEKLEEMYLRHRGINVVMCHYAFAVWDKSHRGAIHLYGHSHSEAEPWLERMMVGRRSMDVGVDNANKLLGSFRPFRLEEIEERLLPRPGFAFDHHVNANSNTPSEEELN